MNVADRMFIDDLQKSKKTVPACYGCIYQSISVREALEFSNKSPLAGISIFERSSVEQLKDIDK
jgi:hypothetical protein